jgi:hypothetical protein
VIWRIVPRVVAVVALVGFAVGMLALGHSHGRAEGFRQGRRFDRAEAYYHGYVSMVGVREEGRLVIYAPWKDRTWEFLKSKDIKGQGAEFWDSVRPWYAERGEAGSPLVTGDIPQELRGHSNGKACPEYQTLTGAIELGE